MSLPVRLEKLRHIVDELHIAQHLALEAADSAASRMIARHILVRAFDFIAHARTLRKPLQEAGFAVQDFHQLKETYAGEFYGCFIDTRHRLGAHVQDLDLADRLLLWNDVEAVKADYFVEGAREIHDQLAGLSIPGLDAFEPPPELGEPGLAAILLQWKTLAAAHPGFEMASDALALTRANTASLINTTPVHQRAGQLALLRRWIDAQTTMIADLEPYPRIARILKSRILTDVVSFADCLITRPLPAGAPQEMQGLDDLVRAGGQSARPIEDLRANLDLDGALGPLRRLRNTVGGHLDGDTTVPLTSLLAALDASPLDQAVDLFRRLDGAFAKTCRNVIYLGNYAVSGQRLRGITALVGGGGAIPYQIDRPDAVLTLERPAFDQATVHARLQDWMAGEPGAAERARDYFRQAFGAAPVDRIIEREEKAGAAVRHHRVEITTVHAHLEQALSTVNDDETAGRLIELLVSNVGGSAMAAAEILLVYAESGRIHHAEALIDALGLLAPWWHEPVKRVLHAAARQDETCGFWARTALARMFLRAEGLARANRRPAVGTWASIEPSLLSGLTPRDVVIQRLIWLSLFWDQRMGVFGQQFEAEITGLRQAVIDGLKALTDPAAWAGRAPVLDTLLNVIDPAGVAVLLFASPSPRDDPELVNRLLWAVCGGPAVPAQRDDAHRHLAFCYDQAGDRVTACEIATRLAMRNPEQIDYQLLKLELAGPDDTEAVLKEAGRLRGLYGLDDDQTSRLYAVEQSRAAIPSSPPDRRA